MSPPTSPDIVVYVCSNSIAPGARFPRQWRQDGAQVLVREMPCSGKMDCQYLFHAFEGGSRGLCVVACPKGECRLSQGNYRAEVRIRTVAALLAEIGLEPERVELLHASPDDPPEQLESVLRDAVRRIGTMGPAVAAAEEDSKSVRA